jgi:hypothetical protein
MHATAPCLANLFLYRFGLSNWLFIYMILFSPAASLKSGQFDRIKNFEKANIEYRISNNECRRNVFYLSYKKIERSETILRKSAVRYSKFCGLLFGLAESHTGPYLHDKVSYEILKVLNPQIKLRLYLIKETERRDSILPHSTFRLPHSSNVVSCKFVIPGIKILMTSPLYRLNLTVKNVKDKSK